jgi:hypothetical protein
VLEPCEAKVSRTVLRGLGLREGARLLGVSRGHSCSGGPADAGATLDWRNVLEGLFNETRMLAKQNISRTSFGERHTRHQDRPGARKNLGPSHQPQLYRFPGRGRVFVLIRAADSYHPPTTSPLIKRKQSEISSSSIRASSLTSPDVFVLAQPSGDLVRQDRTRGPCARHFHLGTGLGSQAPPLHQRLIRPRPPDSVEILRLRLTA